MGKRKFKGYRREKARMTITPEQAIDTLDQAVSKLSTDRNGHIILQQCIQVLKDLAQNAAQLGRDLSQIAADNQTLTEQVESLKTQLRMALEGDSSDPGQSGSVDAEFVA